MILSLSKHNQIKRLGLLILSLFLPSILSALSPNAALNELIQGNKRFYTNNPRSYQDNNSSRIDDVSSQQPFAIVVACADSRVAPEIVFDQTIGTLFVIRVAGNVIGPYELESIQYAIDHLGSSCILVMGHQNCGAVDAVVQNQVQEIPFISQLIKPTVIKAKSTNTRDLLKTSIKMNAVQMTKFLKQLNPYKQKVSSGELSIYPAYYDFESGRVQILAKLPQQ